MRTEFEIRMTLSGMYRFLMYHAYHSFGGVFSIVAGLGLIVFFIWDHGAGTNSWTYLAFGVIFLLYEPWTLYVRAGKLVKLSPVYRHPLHYTISGEGIEVRQVVAGPENGAADAQSYAESLTGQEPTQAGWDSVLLVRETAQSILVYTGKKNACIWLKRQLGPKEAEVRKILRKYVPAQRLKLRQEEI